MQNPQVIVGTALALFIAATIFFIPIHEVEEIEIYYADEPITFEKTLENETQIPQWIFWDATEVQYTIKNTDVIDGVFTLNFVFRNDKDIESTTKRITILSGAQEAITEVSPLFGVSHVTLNVIPSTKSVPHERVITKKITTWDKLRELRSIFR